MTILHIIGLSIFGLFFTALFFFFAAFESDGFEKIPVGTIIIFLLLLASFLISQ
jgi:hypothetical protein